MENNEEHRFSRYEPPIWNTESSGEMTLEELYEEVKSDKWKFIIQRVQRHTAYKAHVLSSTTPSLLSSYRSDDAPGTYSGIVHFDQDHLTDKYHLNLDDVKRLLSEDKVLNFNLIYVSPSGTGLKLFITVNGARAEEHDLCYTAVMDYLAKTYNLICDPSCRNISRACFMSWDPEAYYSEGSVDREVLLGMLPPPAPAPGRDAIDRVSTGTTTRYVSTATSVPAFDKPTYTTGERPSDLLNRLPEIVARAKADLRADGWIQNGEQWTRPGKDLKEGNSAIFNYYPEEDMHFFTNFSTNSPHFGRKGYTCVQIINELEFSGVWSNCITQLAHEYL